MTTTIVDPQNPVVINVSAVTNPASADLIRKFMKVSSGDTNLGNGNYAAVTAADWTDIFAPGKETSESYLWCAAFFAQAPNATAYVFEASAVADLSAFIAAGTAPVYMYSCPAAWYDANTYVPAYLTGGNTATDVVATWNAVTDGSFSITIDGVVLTLSDLDFSLCATMADVAAVIQAGIRAITRKTETCVWSTDHFVIHSVSTTAASAITVTSATGSGTDISGVDTTAFMDANTGHGVVTAAVQTPASNPLIALVKSKVALTAATYFAIEITHGVSPVQDTNFAAYGKSKSLFPVYGNGVATESVPGTMLGIMASGVYDLSESNKATMLCYKKTNGLTVENINVSLRTDLNNSGCNYIGEISGDAMIFNGRYADLTTWDYWYEWDWTMINLLNSFVAAIVNGSNVPAAAIQYNQNGVDALTSVANGVGERGKLFGTITEFGKSYNILTGQIDGKGSFAAIPFYTYIANNPADYAAGIYEGLSAYILIGRFIREVVLNITLN